MVQDPIDDYSARAAQAVADRDATIPKDWLLPKTAYPLPNNVTPLLNLKLSPQELAIVDLPAYELRDKIAAGKLSAVDVTTAYLKAAAVAQQTVNCVVELIPEEALERARWLDEQLKSTGKPVGPLHGVPVSLKDHINLKGHDSPCGILSFVGNMVAEEDAHLVSILRDAGAVFHVSEFHATRSASSLANRRNHQPSVLDAPRDLLIPRDDSVPLQPGPHQRWQLWR